MKCISRSTTSLASLALLLPALAFAAGDPPAACLAVDGPRILAADLARAVPAFSALPPDHDIGPAPSGNLIRTFQRSQLQSHLPAPADLPIRLCVERRRAPIRPALWQSAVDSAVAAACGEMPWKAVILDVPAHSFPEGQIVLKPSGLVARRDAEHLWRGALLLPDKSSLPIWVRLELRSLRHVRTLNRPLPLGAAVTPADFTDEEKWLPGLCPANRAPFDPAGLVTRQSLSLGAELLPLHFRRTAAVRRGDTVDVSLRAGPALLKISAVAEHDADTGRPVLLKSSWNGSRITARVTGPGKAEIEP